MSRVAITRCENYEYRIVQNAVREVIASSSFPDCKGRKILIKPNILSDSRPEKGITTHPAVVRALAEECLERGAEKVFIGDSPGLHSPHFSPVSSGIAAVCNQTGAQWADFTQDSVSRTLPDGTRIQIASVLDQVDFVISAAKFKTHQLMYLTGCVKNMFGLMPRLNKSSTHLRFPDKDDFARFLQQLFEVSKTAYALMDACIVMEGAGPANGTLRYAGLLIGSDNAYLVDKAEAIMMGYDPASIPVLKGRKELSMNENYPLLDAHDLVIKDFRRIDVKKADNLFSALILPFFTRIFGKRKTEKGKAPSFSEKACVHCLRCVKICPAHALSHAEGKIKIDTGKCIRCYCCAEMCPADAISVKES